MRRAFTASLGQLMDADERIVLLTADLGYSVLEPLFDAHPRRVVNVGVAEQNMAGVAAGMAHSGMVPFIYSIATFASLRGYEFIRNGALAHDLKVRVIGVGGGFEYGAAGISHYALEDLAVMRAQPGMAVVAPADGRQAVAALAATWDRPGPVYYRVGKNDNDSLAELDGRFRVGRLELIGTGTDVAIIATGTAAIAASAAADLLAGAGVSCTVGVAACLAPAPAADIAALAGRSRMVMTAETHYAAGGLGSLVAEVMADQGIARPLLRAAVDTVPADCSGSQQFMEHRYGLDAESLARRVQAALPASASRGGLSAAAAQH